MSATQPEPNPFSREGSEPGDGLGSGPNRFDTWADGSTPLGQPAPPSGPTHDSSPSDEGPTPNGAADAAAPTPHSTGPGPGDQVSFPLYGSAGSSSGYADPEPDDEAYAAFRGYQASTQNYPAPNYPAPNYPAPGFHPYQGYQGQQGYEGYPSQSQPGVYGRPYSTFGPRMQNSPYAVPALILGIVGTFCAITGPVGLGLGIAALKQIDAEPQRYRGRGLAIGGIVTGAIGTLWMLLFILGALA